MYVVFLVGFLVIQCDCALLCDFFRGVEYEYNTLAEFTLPSPDECCLLCTNTPECVSFTFYFRSGLCSLKHTESPSSSRRGAISGRKATPPPPPPLPGAVNRLLRTLEKSSLTIYLFGSDLPDGVYTSQILTLPSSGRLYEMSGRGIGELIKTVPHTISDPKHRVVYTLYTANGIDSFNYAIIDSSGDIKESATIQIVPLDSTIANFTCGSTEQNSTHLKDIAEMRTVQITHENVLINFAKEFVNPVVIAQPLSMLTKFRNGQTAVPRITAVTNKGFSVQVQEAPSLDGIHEEETLTYLAIELGSWRLQDGTRIEVGKVVTDATVGTNNSDNSWEVVPFPSSTLFETPPVVISQVQTKNDPHWVKTRQKSVTTSGFAVTLEEEQSNELSHGGEIVGWIAIEPEVGIWNKNNLFEAGIEINVDAKHRDWWHRLFFKQNFTKEPLFLAILTTFDDSDPAHLRYRGLDEKGVSLTVQEDQEKDWERQHKNEKVAYLALEPTSSATNLTILNAISSNCYFIPTAFDQSVTIEIGHISVIKLKFKNERNSVRAVVLTLPKYGTLYQYQVYEEENSSVLNFTLDSVGTVVDDEIGRLLYLPSDDVDATLKDWFNYQLRDDAGHVSNIATITLKSLPNYIPTKETISSKHFINNPIIVVVGIFGFLLAAGIIVFCAVFLCKRPTARQEFEGFISLNEAVEDKDGGKTYFTNQEDKDVSIDDSLEELDE